MSELPPLPPRIGALAGPLLLGYFFNWALLGALSVQVYFYHIMFPKDRIGVKCLVYSVFILDFLQTILLTHDAFAEFASGYGNIVELLGTQILFFDVPILSGIISGCVQIFFAYRIRVLSKSNIIPIAVILLSLTQSIASLYEGIIGKPMKSLADLSAVAFVPNCIWLSCSAAADITITISMTYLLSRSKKETGFKATRSMVSRIIWLTVGTGMLTAFCAIIGIIIFLAFPHDVYYMTVALVLAKLYSNSMLVILNNRSNVRPGGQSHHELFSTGAQSHPGASGASGTAVGLKIPFQKDVYTATHLELANMRTADNSELKTDSNGFRRGGIESEV